MALFRGLLVLAAIALAIGEQVEAGDITIHNLCNRLAKQMRGYEELRSDGKKAFDFAKIYIEKNTGFLDAERMLVRAWEAVSKGECSSSSWNYIRLINKCYTEYMYALDEPIKTYPEKCLTSEHASQKIKDLTNGMFPSRVDLIDAQFIKKCYENDQADNLDSGRSKSEGLAQISTERSTSAVVDAIERDFVRRAKDPKKAFYADPSAVSKYLKKKLFKPCAVYVNHYEPILSQIRVVSLHLDGRQNALFGLLDQQAREIIFRLRYCSQVDNSSSFRAKMIKGVAKKFL